MKESLKPYPLEDRLMAEMLKTARKNWNDWQTVFEHGVPIDNNPLLADERKFRSFLREYSVNRTIGEGKHDEFRRELQNSLSFKEAIDDDSGVSLDTLEPHLRRRFGSKQGKNRLISVLSKVAAFVRPERFVAWDRFARRGLNIVLGRGVSSPFDTYCDYLKDFDTAWNGQWGQGIKHYMVRNTERALETEPRFQRRVFDVYLMKCGGRWSRKRRGT